MPDQVKPKTESTCKHGTSNKQVSDKKQRTLNNERKACQINFFILKEGRKAEIKWFKTKTMFLYFLY